MTKEEIKSKAKKYRTALRNIKVDMIEDIKEIAAGEEMQLEKAVKIINPYSDCIYIDLLAAYKITKRGALTIEFPGQPINYYDMCLSDIVCLFDALISHIEKEKK